MWGFVGGAPVDHRLTADDPEVTQDEVSRVLSKDLKKRRFSFVGPVITYSYLQAIGAVNDHLVDCPWRP